jgi:hypothetical protein
LIPPFEVSMPPYRFHVRTTQAADNELLRLLVSQPRLWNAITRATSDIDRVLGMGPPNQGTPRPVPGYSDRRVVSIGVIQVGFHYDPNGLEVVVTSIESNPSPPYLPP